MSASSSEPTLLEQQYEVRPARTEDLEAIHALEAAGYPEDEAAGTCVSTCVHDSLHTDAHIFIYT
jgi:hypothetical protein